MRLRLQRIDPGEEMERGKGEGERLKEKVSVDKSKSERLQVGGPPLTGHAVCLARLAGPGRALGMTRFNATLQWAANGS